MKYKDKTKEQRLNELAELHRRIEDLDAKHQTQEGRGGAEGIRKKWEKENITTR
jgi:hypothetical protein